MTHPVRTLASIACILPILIAAPTAGAQSWSWPERAENLQQLPKDFPGDRLRAVMTGFTRALGVRCSHCHVSEEGAPLATYDFASDDNANKQTARAMLAMLETINGQLEKIEPTGDRRVNMWCHTCHAGRPRPMTLGEELGEAYRADGARGVIARYEDLRERFHGKGAYRFDEGALNEVGYVALNQAADTEGAIAIFRLNAEAYPESGNVWDSLGEAFKAAGKREQARVYYQKSLELDPGNENAAAKLRELREAATGGN